MAYDEITALLGGWEAFELIGMARQSAQAERAPQITLTLRAVPGVPKRCSACDAVVDAVHDTSERRVRDLPILEAETWLVLPLAHVAAWHGVHWSTVKAIDHRALVERLGPVALDGLRVLAIDEFALHKGHRYATVVVDPLRKRVLWVGVGRSRDDLRAFFALLGPARCAQIEAVAMDMSPAFAAEVTAHCPQAALVFDLFHVVAKYGRDVLDRIRVDETNKLAKAAGPNRRTIRTQRRVIKGAHWLLLRNRANVTRHADRVRLRELLRANRALFIAYVLKDESACRAGRPEHAGAGVRADHDGRARSGVGERHHVPAHTPGLAVPGRRARLGDAPGRGLADRRHVRRGAGLGGAGGGPEGAAPAARMAASLGPRESIRGAGPSGAGAGAWGRAQHESPRELF